MIRGSDELSRTRLILLRRWLIGVSLIALAIAAIWLFQSYQKYQARVELLERKTPFAQVVVLAIADGEEVLQEKGLIGPGKVARVACGLDVQTCGMGIVQSYSIAEDGSVAVVLAGNRQPSLEGKVVALKPRVSNGEIAWTCRTNAPPDMVPNPEDHPPSLFTLPCTALGTTEAERLRREVNATGNQGASGIPGPPPPSATGSSNSSRQLPR